MPSCRLEDKTLPEKQIPPKKDQTSAIKPPTAAPEVCLRGFPSHLVKKVEEVTEIRSKKRWACVAKDLELDYKTSLLLYETKYFEGIAPANATFRALKPETHGMDLRNAYGVGFGDFDGDGWSDILVAGWYRTKLYQNLGNQKFREISGPWNMRAVGAVRFVDSDGDGLTDIFLVQKPIKGKFHLLKQLKDGWKDVTLDLFPENENQLLEKGDRAPNYWCSMIETPIWFDHNGDGRLDVAIQGYPLRHRHQHRFYLQTENGTFVNKIGEIFPGLSRNVCGEGGLAVDWDLDGDVDLFVYGHLYENVGGTYIRHQLQDMKGDEAPFRHTNEEGVAAFDFDNDGDFDIVACCEGGAILYEQVAPWKFTVRRRFRTYCSVNCFDCNMDGKIDLMFGGTGRYENYRSQNKAELFVNTGDDFIRMTGELGLITDYFTYNLAVGDIDNDGDYDLLTGHVLNSKPELGHPGILYENLINPSDYMVIEALDEHGRRNQFGAVVQVFQEDGTLHALRFVNGGHGYLGQDDYRIIVATKPAQKYKLRVIFPRQKRFHFHQLDWTTNSKLGGIVLEGGFADRTVSVHRDGRVIIGGKSN